MIVIFFGVGKSDEMVWHFFGMTQQVDGSFALLVQFFREEQHTQKSWE